MATKKDTPQQNVPDPSKRGLNAEEVTIVRQMLLIGLAAYGEIERLGNAAEMYKKFSGTVPMETLVNEMLPDMMPIHPTGSTSTVSDFADALRAMEHAEVTDEN